LYWGKLQENGREIDKERKKRELDKTAVKKGSDRKKAYENNRQLI
jgi:hypothetical protein